MGEEMRRLWMSYGEHLMREAKKLLEQAKQAEKEGELDLAMCLASNSNMLATAASCALHTAKEAVS